METSGALQFMIFVLVAMFNSENVRKIKSSRILLENREKMYTYILKEQAIIT